MCADAPNRGVSPQVCLLVTSVPRFSRCAVSFCGGHAIAGHGTPALRVVSGRDFPEGGSRRTRLLLCHGCLPAGPPESAPASAATTRGQARLAGSIRSKWPAPGISTSEPAGKARLISTGTCSSAVPWTSVTGTAGRGSAAGSATA